MQPEDTSVEDVEPPVKVAERDKQLRHVESERSAVKAATDTFCVELNNLEREVMSRLDKLDAEFDASPDHARKTLTACGFEPHNGVYRVVGSIAVPGLLMAGTAPDRFASPGRFAPV